MRWLGFEVRDRITGLRGVVASVSFDLYGCVQALVTPMASKDGKPLESYWFDTKRLAGVSKAPVMEVPQFEEIPGGLEHPPYRSQPRK
jgi:hypothetical protein